MKNVASTGETGAAGSSKTDPKTDRRASNGLVAFIDNGGPNPRAEVTDAGVAVVQRMASEGHNQATIATALGLSKRTLGRAMEAQEELREAFEGGRGVMEQELASMLLSRARAGNLTAMIFLLKAQCGWRDTGDMQRGPSVAVSINLPAAMSEAAYADLLRLEAPPGPPSADAKDRHLHLDREAG